MGGPPDTAGDCATRPAWAGHVVLGWLCAAAAIAYVQRNSISAAESTIRGQMRWTEEEMGWVLSAFFVGYTVMQIPAGWLGHVWGSRRGLALFMGFSSVAAGLFAVPGRLAELWAARFGMGAAQAGIFPCAAHTITQRLPATQRAMASGLLASAMSVGGALGASLTGVLLAHLTWRQLYVLYALPGLLWAVGFYVWFRDRPTATAGPPAEPPEPTPWRTILTSPAMGWVCGQQFFRAAGYNFYASWFATYLQVRHQFNIREAGLLNSLPLLAVVVGSPAGGALSDYVLRRTGSRTRARRSVALFSQTAAAVLMLVPLAVPRAEFSVLVIVFSSFCAAMGGACAYSVTMDMAGNQVAPVFSTMNMAGNLGATIFPVVVPWLVAWAGGWGSVLVFCAAIYLCSAGCWLFVNPEASIVGPAVPDRTRS